MYSIWVSFCPLKFMVESAFKSWESILYDDNICREKKWKFQLTVYQRKHHFSDTNMNLLFQRKCVNSAVERIYSWVSQHLANTWSTWIFAFIIKTLQNLLLFRIYKFFKTKAMHFLQMLTSFLHLMDEVYMSQKLKLREWSYRLKLDSAIMLTNPNKSSRQRYSHIFSEKVNSYWYH